MSESVIVPGGGRGPITPTEAFDWLIGRFLAYLRHEIIWTDARQVLNQARAMHEDFVAVEQTENDDGETR